MPYSPNDIEIYMEDLRLVGIRLEALAQSPVLDEEATAMSLSECGDDMDFSLQRLKARSQVTGNAAILSSLDQLHERINQPTITLSSAAAFPVFLIDTGRVDSSSLTRLTAFLSGNSSNSAATLLVLTGPIARSSHE